MIKYFSEDIRLDEISSSLNSLASSDDISSLLVFIADNPELNLDGLDKLFKSQLKPTIGGIFPELIFDNQKKSKGFYIIGLMKKITTCLLDLNESKDKFEIEIEKFASESDKNASTIWVFMDAFSENKDDAINMLYDEFGPNKNYIGGGAGTLQLKSTPCIISNHGLKSHCAIIATMAAESAVGVAHGWQPISEPIKVTKTEGRRIKSFEWKNAFDYYFNKIKEHSGLEINEDNFFDIAKSYPLGLIKLNSEFIVRDPISTDGNHLNIIDKVPENEFIQILNGDKLTLFQGAAIAKQNAKLPFTENHFYFCIDCISRVLFLGDEFNRELSEISGDDVVIGVLTIGEIANSGNSMLEIYNKTVVVCNIAY
jgi:hypothetical protein